MTVKHNMIIKLYNGIEEIRIQEESNLHWCILAISSMWEAKAGGSQMWFDLDYVIRPILKNKNKKDFYKAYYC